MCNYCSSHNIFDKNGNRVRGMTGKEIRDDEDWWDGPRGGRSSIIDGGESPNKKQDPGFDHGDDPRL